MLDRCDRLLEIARQHGVLAVYLFGSRAADGHAHLEGHRVAGGGSDLDVGVVFVGPPPDLSHLATLQVALEDLFAPLRVDLVPLQRVDALFQMAAIDGYLAAATDSTDVSLFELSVMRRAAELLPVQREIERATFGITTR
jgi:predicted nucleotidyltransferase